MLHKVNDLIVPLQPFHQGTPWATLLRGRGECVDFLVRGLGSGALLPFRFGGTWFRRYFMGNLSTHGSLVLLLTAAMFLIDSKQLLLKEDDLALLRFY